MGIMLRRVLAYEYKRPGTKTGGACIGPQGKGGDRHCMGGGGRLRYLTTVREGGGQRKRKKRRIGTKWRVYLDHLASASKGELVLVLIW